MPLKLFEDLGDGEINPKEVLKNQARFKSNLSEIKTLRKKYEKKIVDFLEVILFHYLKLITRQNMEKDLKY